ncbi:LOW QUALITY PROTEIN: hypothetical protein QYF61_025208, partial [Mycteria americana]
MSLSTTSPRVLNTCRDGDSTTSLGSLFQCLTTLSLNKFFLISNLNLPWCNLRPFPLVLSLVTWEKRPTPPRYTLLSESDEVSPQPPFLQAEQPQFPQPLPISLVLQTLHQLRCPSLDTLQPLNVSLVVRGPKLNTGFEATFEASFTIQGHDHFPSPAGHAMSDTSQDAIGLLGRLGTLLAHIQAAVDQHSQVLFLQAAFQPLFPKPVALHGVAVTQVQGPTLGLVKPHTIDLGPSIQPVQVPLQSLPTLQQINAPTQLGAICKLSEGALDALIEILDKDIKQNWPQVENYHFVIALPKTASKHRITHKSFSVHKQEVQQVPSLAGSLTSCVRKLSATHSRNLRDHFLSAEFDFQQTSGCPQGPCKNIFLNTHLAVFSEVILKFFLKHQNKPPVGLDQADEGFPSASGMLRIPGTTSQIGKAPGAPAILHPMY